jgi:hypothetical protein
MPMSNTTCPKCHGKGFIPTRGYRFYSLNATFCPCGAYPNLTAACNAEAARNQAEGEAIAAAYSAERRAARLARREARRAAAAEAGA